MTIYSLFAIELRCINNKLIISIFYNIVVWRYNVMLFADYGTGFYKKSCPSGRHEMKRSILDCCQWG